MTSSVHVQLCLMQHDMQPICYFRLRFGVSTGNMPQPNQSVRAPKPEHIHYSFHFSVSTVNLQYHAAGQAILGR